MEKIGQLNFDFAELQPESKLRTNKKGQQFLVVFYDNDDFEDAINIAKKYHGLEDATVVILALPRHAEPYGVEQIPPPLTKERLKYLNS